MRRATCNDLEEAAKLGAGIHLSGESSGRTTRLIREPDFAPLAANGYATERYGYRRLAGI